MPTNNVKSIIISYHQQIFDKMEQLSIIKSEKQYFAYCDEVEHLESIEDKTDSIEDRIELLILLIEKWDKEQYAIPELNPVEYLKLLMDNNGLKSVDIQNETGIDKTTLSHILNYRRGFSKKNIRLLSDFFKVSQSTFNKKYELTKVSKTKAAFELYKSEKTGKYHFRLKARNNQIILASEAYNTKKAAEKSIISIQKYAFSASNFEEKEATDGRTYFVVKAKNGEVVGTSQMYKSKSGLKKGMNSLLNNSQSPVVEIGYP